MPAAQRFLFETSFDREHEAGAGTASQPVAEASYDEAAMIAVRQQAFADGQAAGATAVRAMMERQAVDALAALERHIGEIGTMQAAANQAAGAAAVEAAVALVRKLHPELNRRGGLLEIEGLLGACLRDIREEPRIVVRVHDELLDILKARLDPVAAAAGFEGRFVLLADDGIPLGDCRVEWADGGVERDAGRLWREIEAAVARAIAAAPSAAAPALSMPAVSTSVPATPTA